MKRFGFDGSRTAIRSAALLTTIAGIGFALAAWKQASAEEAQAATASAPEPMEVVTEAVASEYAYRATTTSIGTVLATRSVSLRNELAGTVRSVRLEPGSIVDAGTVLVALDVSVERAELRALEARAELAATTLARVERMAERRAVSAIDLDNARAERDIALAEIERIRAVIERKTIRTPFRARVGIADVHPGQFLEAGTLVTTLQGVADAVHVDFAVAQDVAAGLGQADSVEVFADERAPALVGRVVAVDARIDPETRNAMVRARIDGVGGAVTPGASVRVRVPVGASRPAVVIPASALRRGPAGDHVFALETGREGEVRAHLRPVRAGPLVGDEMVILGGLEAGERVAAAGSFKLRDSALVHIAAAAGSPAAAGS